MSTVSHRTIGGYLTQVLHQYLASVEEKPLCCRNSKSTCILLYQEPLGEVAKQRLATMRDTDDGFVIAEADLKLRGAGEVLGTAQSGLPLFKIADLSVHGELLIAARDDAQLIILRDASLASPRGVALRNLLYLFERETAIRLLASG